MNNKLKQDIEILKDICSELEEHYYDADWDLTDFQRQELDRITGLEEHDWDDSNLAHFIDGMQRAFYLESNYNE